MKLRVQIHPCYSIFVRNYFESSFIITMHTLIKTILQIKVELNFQYSKQS